MEEHFSSSDLTTKMLRRLRHQKHLKQAGNLQDSYEYRVWSDLNRLDSILGETKGFLLLMPTVTTSCTSALICNRLYILSQCAIFHSVAKLINTFFELGLHSDDLHFNLIFRNAYVRHTELPNIFEKHKDTIEYEKISSYGRQIVKKGVLADPEIEKMRERITNISLLKALGIDQTKNKDDLDKVSEDLESYSLRKQATFETHLEGTVKWLDEMLVYLTNLYDEISKTT